MATWVLKTEPSTFSFQDLVEKKRAVWDGVANPVAQKHIRGAQRGDLCVVYHTGKERAAVGLAEIASAPYPDPKDAKLHVFDLVPKGALARPVTLDAIKASPAFADSPLVTMGRLSVVPLTDLQWRALKKMAA